ncbi:hypothetical protein DFJ74DRAFT_307727 [Hyaloraphidium curvatum]|nr:hypothetical protein DFJ74DRAFT_307727 [Hyaloraphidium curvatum]
MADMDMDIDDAAPQPIFISPSPVSTTRLRGDGPSRPPQHQRRGSISAAMSWKNSLGNSFNLLRHGTGTLNSMFSTSPVGNTIMDMLSRSLTSGSFKDLHRIEQSFMQDFTCCGLVLRDLHELVQHWEEHQVDQGMETDMTLEDDDGWDDDTRTVPEEGETDHQRMMMGEMEFARLADYSSPNLSATTSATLPTMYPSMRVRERDSASPRPETPPTVLVTSYPPAPQSPFTARPGMAPIEGMRGAPLEDAAPPSGVNPLMVGVEPQSILQPRALPTTPNTVVEEDDPTAGHGQLPSFDDVGVAVEVEEYSEDDEEEDVEELLDPGLDVQSTESDVSSPGETRRSESKHRGKRYPCTFPECDKVYKNPGGLKYHLAHTHPDPDTTQIPPGLLGRNGKRGKNVPDIYKPYRCMVVTCGKRYKNLNGLKYHLEHHHTDIQDDPVKMNLPRIIDKEGKVKWDLSGCYDPLIAKPGKKPQVVAAAAKPEPKPSSSSSVKAKGKPPTIPVAAPAAPPQQHVFVQHIPPTDPAALPPMGLFTPAVTVPAVPVVQMPMNPTQLQVLASAIQQAAQTGQATPEQASQMMANLMAMAQLNQ